jgi:hypothetical protein
VVVEGDAQSEDAHLLLELVEHGEVTVYAVVLGDELEERNSHVPEDDVVTLFSDVVILDSVL